MSESMPDFLKPQPGQFPLGGEAPPPQPQQFDVPPAGTPLAWEQYRKLRDAAINGDPTAQAMLLRVRDLEPRTW
jgi:hypothetical protein